MHTLNETTSQRIENLDFLFFKKKRTLQKVSIASIDYIQAADDYSISYTKDGYFLSSLRMKELEQLLEKHGFFRVHRSYLLNLAAVTSIDMRMHKINIAGEIIPFSRRIKKELTKRLVDNPINIVG